MLLMICSFGGALRIGEGLTVSLHGRIQDRVAITVMASAGSHLVFDGAALSPLCCASGQEAYHFSLRHVRRFRVDGVQVMVWLPGDAVPLAAECLDCVHIGIEMPSSLRVSYEHAGAIPEASQADARHLWN